MSTDRVLGCERCRSVPAAAGELALDHARNLFSESHEAYAIFRCRACGQAFLEQFQEVIDWVGEEDDIWERWTPLTADALAEVDRLFPAETEDYDEVPRLTALMHRRGRLTRDPDGQFSWSGQGRDAGNLPPPG